MRRVATLAGCLMLGAMTLAAEGKESGGENGTLELWKWANFAVLAIGLGYLVMKNAGPYFASRSKQIQKDMADADAARKAAEAKAADVDRRLASLEGEIGALRAEAQQQGRVEMERMAQRTSEELAKVQERAEQDIAAAAKAARLELKRYSAELALDLAEGKIRSRMTPAAEDELVRGFVQNLK